MEHQGGVMVATPPMYNGSDVWVVSTARELSRNVDDMGPWLVKVTMQGRQYYEHQETCQQILVEVGGQDANTEQVGAELINKRCRNCGRV